MTRIVLGEHDGAFEELVVKLVTALVAGDALIERPRRALDNLRGVGAMRAINPTGASALGLVLAGAPGSSSSGATSATAPTATALACMRLHHILRDLRRELETATRGTGSEGRG
eukprot:1386676-Rhodomonas_salina.1